MSTAYPIEPAETPEPFPLVNIRYEGRDAARHEIELNQLGESLQGFARIIAVTANYLQTGRVNRHFDALSVKVMAIPVTDHRCHEVVVFIKSFFMTKEFFAGLGSGLLPAIVAYVVSRRDNEEMKHLSAALQKQMDLAAQSNERLTQSLISVIDKLADQMRPAIKKALAPVGRSCESVDLYADGRKFHHIDPELKEAITSESPVFSDHSRLFSGVISELDTKTGAAKITLDLDTERLPCQILDPAHAQPGNAYAEALASGSRITVLAKAELDSDGAIAKLFILDTAVELPPPPAS
jgi:hypothetical protein